MCSIDPYPGISSEAGFLHCQSLSLCSCSCRPEPEATLENISILRARALLDRFPTASSLCLRKGGAADSRQILVLSRECGMLNGRGAGLCASGEYVDSLLNARGRNHSAGGVAFTLAPCQFAPGWMGHRYRQKSRPQIESQQSQAEVIRLHEQERMPNNITLPSLAIARQGSLNLNLIRKIPYSPNEPALDKKPKLLRPATVPLERIFHRLDVHG